MPKCEGKVHFRLPASYYPDKYKTAIDFVKDWITRDCDETVDVPEIQPPDLTLPLQLDFYDEFSMFVPAHREMAKSLIHILMNAKNLEEFQCLAIFCQMRINPSLFNYALSVAILNRKDTKGINIPSFAELFPGKFIDPWVLECARKAVAILLPDQRKPITIPQNYTAASFEPEQRVAYFREDIGVNLHHWHWHLVYPMDANDLSIIDKDRRGELFYYMHQQIIARYNIERYCNNLSHVVPYDLKSPIEEGYFPKMNSKVASRAWPPRFTNTTMYNLDRPDVQVRIDLSDMFRYRDNIEQAIENMEVILPGGGTMSLEGDKGIDVLGNLIEASALSPNKGYYGDYHNGGHLFISYSHDPENRYLEKFAVMGDPTTAMRDPVFYRWHTHIDNLFQLYKSKLPPYTKNELEWSGVSVHSVGVESAAGASALRTQWERSALRLDRGLDFAKLGSVLGTVTHLTHHDFVYAITVENTRVHEVTGTVRLFMAPTQNDKGDWLKFEEQRRLMIELDKFTHPIPVGRSTISRRSLDSSVTIPYDRTFRPQSERPGEPGFAEAAAFDFCGCGWPHHLLIPKGTASGFAMTLFCMITNWEEDRVAQDLVGACNDAASYCGIRDRKYPDRRAMGFPFDRRAPANVLKEFLTLNMATSDIIIRFKDEIRDHQNKD
ncbi:unnamed protein product [Euphydryas editha]|nr:unnamed protein product [Euphydryas editha]